MNPLAALPPKVRLYAYALLATAALAIAAYRAAEGDWLVFAGLLLGSLGFGTAASNVDTTKPGAVTVRLSVDDAAIQEALREVQAATDQLGRRLDREPVDPTDLGTDEF